MNIDNSIAIHGRIVRDIELKTAANGTKFAKFTVAVDRRGKGDGDKTDFFDCVAFKNSAELIAKYFQKGRPIRLTGSMECDPYTAKDGTKRYPWALKVDGWGFDMSDPKGTSSAPASAPAPVGEVYEDASDEDIPF